MDERKREFLWGCSFPLWPSSALTHWFHSAELTFSLAQGSLTEHGVGSCEIGPLNNWTGVQWVLVSCGPFDSMWFCLVHTKAFCQSLSEWHCWHRPVVCCIFHSCCWSTLFTADLVQEELIGTMPTSKHASIFQFKWAPAKLDNFYLKHSGFPLSYWLIRQFKRSCSAWGFEPKIHVIFDCKKLSWAPQHRRVFVTGGGCGISS